MTSGSGGTPSGNDPYPQMRRRDSANVPSGHAPSPATLQTIPTQPMIDRGFWPNDDSPDFQERSVASHHSMPRGVSNSQLDKILAASFDNSPMALAYSRSQISSAHPPPSLASGSLSTISGSSSVGTSNASSALKPYQGRLLVEGDHEVLEVQPPPAWTCPLWFLNCHESLDDFEQWDSHFRCHFLSEANLPKSVRCPFECDWARRALSGTQAWAKLQEHIRWYHREGGPIDKSSDPDPDLVIHLWRIRAITDSEEKELRANRCLSSTAAYLVTASSRREQRRRRQPPGRR